MLGSDGHATGKKRQDKKRGDLEYVCGGEEPGQSVIFNKMSGQASLRRQSWSKDLKRRGS